MVCIRGGAFVAERGGGACKSSRPGEVFPISEPKDQIAGVSLRRWKSLKMELEDSSSRLEGLQERVWF